MTNYHVLSKQVWDKTLLQLRDHFLIYAPVLYGENQDYELIDEDSLPAVVYNKPKPASPLKTFFLPIRENVANLINAEKKTHYYGYSGV